MSLFGEVRLGSREAAERQDRGDPARRRNRSSEPTWPASALRDAPSLNLSEHGKVGTEYLSVFQPRLLGTDFRAAT